MSTSGGNGSGLSPIGIGLQLTLGELASTSNGFANGTAYWSPVEIVQPFKLLQAGVNVTAVGDAGCTFTVGVYADDGTNKPGALLAASAAVPGDAVGVNLGAINALLPVGWLWVGAMLLGVTTTKPTVQYRSLYAAPWPTGQIRAWSATAGAPGYYQTGLAALPAQAAPVGGLGSAPLIYGTT